MTEQLFFDTDCISSFLWVKQEDILLSLYPGKIVLPQEVFNELSNPSIPHIKSKIAALQSNGDISTQQILTNTEEYKFYYEMAVSPPKGERVIEERPLPQSEREFRKKQMVSIIAGYDPRKVLDPAGLARWWGETSFSCGRRGNGFGADRLCPSPDFRPHRDLHRGAPGGNLPRPSRTWIVADSDWRNRGGQ